MKDISPRIKKHQQVIIAVLVTALIAGGTGFVLGSKRSGFAGTPGTGRAGFQGGSAARGRSFGGGAFGTVSSKDGNSITISLRQMGTTTGDATGSRIVFFDSKTQIGKFMPGSADDLADGTSVMVNGTPNADGSITAQSIQIRPEGAPSGMQMRGR